jgi:hypothetical protein
MWSNSRLIELYIDYCNNFLTVEYFAEYYDLSDEEANFVINNGRILNNKEI